MKYKLTLILLSVLVFTNHSLAQQATTADEKLEKLRLELIDVQGKEAFLRTRSQQLEEDIKPENIARSLAGYGSTKPEELREFRRRQLVRDGGRPRPVTVPDRQPACGGEHRDRGHLAMDAICFLDGAGCAGR